MVRRLIFAVFIVMTAMVVVLLGLYLFKTGFFPFEKHQKTNQQKSKKRFSCPAPKDYCSKGRIIKADGQTMGMGYQLPVGTLIYQVFRGSIRSGGVAYSKDLGGGRYPSLTIIDEANKLEAVYVFTGANYQSTASSSKGIILQARAGQIANRDVNLLVSIYKTKGKERLPINLTVDDFSDL